MISNSSQEVHMQSFILYYHYISESNRKNKTHFFIYPKLEQWLIWCFKAADQTQISSNKRHCITKIRSRFVLGRE